MFGSIRGPRARIVVLSALLVVFGCNGILGIHEARPGGRGSGGQSEGGNDGATPIAGDNGAANGGDGSTITDGSVVVVGQIDGLPRGTVTEKLSIHYQSFGLGRQSCAGTLCLVGGVTP